MPDAYDVIVVGLGAMGSATLRELAVRGRSVIGFDSYRPPHTQGSSHGLARIIREAYFEHPAYVPLVQRAYRLWNDLERESARRLLIRTGGIMIGAPDGVLVSGATRSAQEHGLSHERLAPADIRRRFPAFGPGEEMVGVWEPRAGVLSPEASIAAFLSSATARGAVARYDEPVESWAATQEGVEVVTARGRYRASRLLLAAGPWLSRLAPRLAPSLTVERVVQVWFEPESQRDDLDPERCPISIWEYQPGRFFYSFPLLGPGVKVAFHHQGRAVDPDRVDRQVAAGEIEAIRSVAGRYIKALRGPLAECSVCLYTNTPDEHFLIDFDPEHPRVLLVSACSGHGFKFAPVIGEIAADLLIDGETRHDRSMFGLGGRMHETR